MTASPAAGHDPRREARALADASPAQVRAALIPEEQAEFDRDWRAALTRAAETLDLTEVHETLEAWRLVAQLTAAQGPAAHRAMYRRAAARLDDRDVDETEPLAQAKARLGL